MISLQLALLAQAAMHVPGTGSAERKEILDALRIPAAVAWQPPVKFVVKDIKVADGYAFVSVSPRRPNGSSIRMMLAGGQGDAYGEGLLHYSAGRWVVINFRAGASDAWFCGYQGMPRAILPNYC